MEISVATSVATETTTGVEGGKDVDVTVTVDGVDYDGEVTLVPDASGDGWRAYGDTADTWVSGDLLDKLTAACGIDLRSVLSAIESAAAEACAD
jgi:hypothetical protein